MGLAATPPDPAPGLMTLACAKTSHFIVIAYPRWSATTTMRSILLVCLSVALRTGYKFLSRKAADMPKQTPTKTQLRRVSCDQEIMATRSQVKLEYPYKAQHSRRLADSEPKYLSASQRIIGIMDV